MPRSPSTVRVRHSRRDDLAAQAGVLGLGRHDRVDVGGRAADVDDHDVADPATPAAPSASTSTPVSTTSGVAPAPSR